MNPLFIKCPFRRAGCSVVDRHAGNGMPRGSTPGLGRGAHLPELALRHIRVIEVEILDTTMMRNMGANNITC